MASQDPTRNWTNIPQGDAAQANRLKVTDLLTGPAVPVLRTDGDPNGTLTGTAGQLALDYATGILWQNVDDDTAWNVYIGGGGAGTVGPGTVDTLAKFTGANAVGDSSVTDNGVEVATSLDIHTTGGNFVGDAGSRLRLGAAITNTDSWIQGPQSPATRVQFYLNLSAGAPQTADESLNIAAVNSLDHDTTAGAATARAVEATVNAHRVAGANPLQCIAVVASAQGGDENYSFYSTHGVMRQEDEARFGANIVGGTATRMRIGAAGGIAADNWNTAPMSVTAQRFVEFGALPGVGGDHTNQTEAVHTSSALTYDLSAGVDRKAIAYDASSTGTRSAGAGRLQNIGVQSNASGGQQNYSWFSNQGWMRQDDDAFFGTLHAVMGKFGAGDEVTVDAAGVASVGALALLAGGNIVMSGPALVTVTTPGDISVTGNSSVTISSGAGPIDINGLAPIVLDSVAGLVLGGAAHPTGFYGSTGVTRQADPGVAITAAQIRTILLNLNLIG